MKLSYVALPLLSSALLLVACGDDASDSGGAPSTGGSAGASGATTNGGSAGTTAKGGSAGETSKGGSAGASGKGGTAGTSAGGKGGTAGTSAGGSGGEGGSATGGKAGTGGANGGQAGTTATGGAAGTTAAAGQGGTAAGGEGGTTAAGGEGGTTAAAGQGGTAAGGEGGSTAAGGEGGTAAGGAGGAAAGAGGAAAGAGGAAAGAGGAAAGAGGAPPVVCREISVTAADGSFYDSAIRFELAPIGGADYDLAGLFLSEKPANGVYQLGVGQNADPNTAKQVIGGYEDVSASTGIAKTRYVSTKGSLSVSAATSIYNVKGELLDVTLSESEVVDDKVVLKPGGQCLHLANAAFDLTKYCVSGEDCSKGETCDPSTFRCASSCANQNQCGLGQSCVAQVDNATVGACYSFCRSGKGATCGGQFSCQAITLAAEGQCISAGFIPEGGTCTGQTDTTTDCAPSLLCVGDVPASGASVCRNTCAALDANPGCPAGQKCLFQGFCTSNADSFDPAPLNGFCSTNLLNCGADAGGARGVCYGATNVCRKVVTKGTACPIGTSYKEVSAALLSNGGNGTSTGVCAPLSAIRERSAPTVDLSPVVAVRRESSRIASQRTEIAVESYSTDEAPGRARSSES
jgi:hypothetical protein